MWLCRDRQSSGHQDGVSFPLTSLPLTPPFPSASCSCRDCEGGPPASRQVSTCSSPPLGDTHGPSQAQARSPKPACVSPRKAAGRTDLQNKPQNLVLNKRLNKMHLTAAPMLSCKYHPLRYLMFLNCPGGFSIL